MLEGMEQLKQQGQLADSDWHGTSHSASLTRMEMRLA